MVVTDPSDNEISAVLSMVRSAAREVFLEYDGNGVRAAEKLIVHGILPGPSLTSHGEADKADLIRWNLWLLPGRPINHWYLKPFW